MSTRSAHAARAWGALLAFLALATAARGAAPPGEPPIISAATAGDEASIARLAKDRRQLFDRDATGRSALIAAVQAGRLAAARQLLRAGIDVDARDMSGMTALHHAVRAGALPLVDALLAAGATARAYDKSCASPLDYAAGFQRRALFDRLAIAFAKTLPPRDGTPEECTHARAVKTPGYAAAALGFHRRRLAVASAEALGPASESARFLAQQPELAARLVPELQALVAHASPPVAEPDPGFDAHVRSAAAVALGRAYPLLTPATRRTLTAAMLAHVRAGDCGAFRQRMCGEEVVQECELAQAKSDFGRAWGLLTRGRAAARERPPWPRSEEQERCFSCRYCEATRAGNALGAGLYYFAMVPAERAAGRKELESLRRRGLIDAKTFATWRGRFDAPASR